MKKCLAQYVGKNRSGAPRYWCVVHHAPISDSQGNILERCLSSQQKPVENEGNSLTLPLSEYPGGISLRGTALAAYSTTSWRIEPGIHTHACQTSYGKKQVDKTFRYVHIQQKGTDAKFDYLASISYLASEALGHTLQFLTCPQCGTPHLDKDWFAANPHKKHLCAYCGRNFFTPESAIGNPLVQSKSILEDKSGSHMLIPSNCSLKISQKDFLYGISIWGTTTAILWTLPQDEKCGIHIHAYARDEAKPTIDETFESIIIDEIPLNAEMVRLYTIQKNLPYLKGKVRFLCCPRCGQAHFDTEKYSYTPHTEHYCPRCKETFRSRAKTIGNPMVQIITALQQHTALPLNCTSITDLYPDLEGW